MIEAVRLERLATNQSIYARFVDNGDDPVSYLIEDITGVGPVAATVNRSNLAGHPGSRVRSVKIGDRSIKLTLEYNPIHTEWQTVSELRRVLYSQLPPGEEVRLTFFSDDEEPLKINGVVETHEPDIFSPDTLVNITFFCEYPFFRFDEVVLNWSSVGQGNFVDFVSAENTGFVLSFVVRSETPVFGLAKTGEDEDMLLRNLLIGDQVTISTLTGDKYVKIFRNGRTIDGLTQLDNLRLWFDLDKDSSNFFWVSRGGGAISDLQFRFAPLALGL